MAINKNQETSYGFDVNHHVLVDITINKEQEELKINLNSYNEAVNYNDSDAPMRRRKFYLKKDDIPPAVLSVIKGLLEDIEDQIIALVPQFVDGTRVKDNGDPV